MKISNPLTFTHTQKINDIKTKITNKNKLKTKKNEVVASENRARLKGESTAFVE